MGEEGQDASSEKKIQQLHRELAESLKQTKSIKNKLSSTKKAAVGKEEEVEAKEEEETKETKNSYDVLKKQARKISEGALNCNKAVDDLKQKLSAASESSSQQLEDAGRNLSTRTTERDEWKKKFNLEMKEQGGRIQKIKGLETEIGQKRKWRVLRRV